MSGHPLDSPELQGALVGTLKDGLTPRYVALANEVAPDTLREWLEAGARRDAYEPFAGFFRRWAKAEAELMAYHVQIWRMGSLGADESREFLERRWPRIWGKNPEADFDPLAPAGTNADELEQLEAILTDPAAYGMLETFARFDRLTTAERLTYSALTPESADPIR